MGFFYTVVLESVSDNKASRSNTKSSSEWHKIGPGILHQTHPEIMNSFDINTTFSGNLTGVLEIRLALRSLDI